MRNGIYLVAMVVIFFTACQADFDPVTDSSVRTICVSVDPSGVLDSFLVAKYDTFILGYRDTLPADMRLRITTYCYRNDGYLHSKQIFLTRDLTTHQIFISHVDTLQHYSICCVADLVHQSLDNVLNYNWVQMIDNQRSSLYMFHSNMNGTIENHVSTIRWEGLASKHIGPLTFKPETYNGYFRLINFQRMNYVYFRWSRYAAISLWDGTYTERFLYNHETEFYPSLTLQDTLIPVYAAYCNDSIYYKTKTRIVSTSDSASYRIYLSHKPFVCTIDCKQLKVTESQYY